MRDIADKPLVLSKDAQPAIHTPGSCAHEVLAQPRLLYA
jgi:hypothetical protein